MVDMTSRNTYSSVRRKAMTSSTCQGQLNTPDVSQVSGKVKFKPGHENITLSC